MCLIKVSRRDNHLITTFLYFFKHMNLKSRSSLSDLFSEQDIGSSREEGGRRKDVRYCLVTPNTEQYIGLSIDRALLWRFFGERSQKRLVQYLVRYSESPHTLTNSSPFPSRSRSHVSDVDHANVRSFVRCTHF